MRHGLAVICCCALLCALCVARVAWADTRHLVARLVLIPQGPGAQISAPSVIAADAVPPAVFDVFLDPELNGQALDAYLADRQRLLAGHFAVWLYRFDDESALGKQGLAGPILVIEADSSGQFPLAGPGLTPGRLYAWQAVASLTDSAGHSVQVFSAPLYFHTAPAEAYLPAVLDPAAHALLGELAQLASDQERARAAMQATLRGLLPYSNYPSSSDLYLSIPLTGDDTCPRPDAPAGWRLDLPRLITLGRTAAALAGGKPAAPPPTGAALSSTGAALYSKLQQWAEHATPAPPKEFAALVDVASRMKAAPPVLETAQAAALYSEFLVSVDALAGPGTLNLRCGYEAAFLAYYAGTQERLAQARRLKDSLDAVLGGQETAAWLGAFTGAGQQLNVLAEAVQRGRLGKNQLTAKLAGSGGAPLLQNLPEAHYLEGEACRADLERIKHLTAADKPQVTQLTAELTRCYLFRLAGALWP